MAPMRGSARANGWWWRADESDGSFTKLPATVAIVTNIDPEHMDHYEDFDAVRRAYDTFVQNIPFYGFAVLCVDHPEVQELIARVQDRKIVTYGFSPQADIRAVNVEAKPDGTRYDVVIADRKTGTERTIDGFFLPVIGQHNVQNSLAAIAVGHQLGFADHVLRAAMSKFEGVKRRFTRTGVVNGITIVDDYGHHPVEIAATLKAAQQAKGESGKIIAVMQPHRYTRLSGLFAEFCTCFNDADSVIVVGCLSGGRTADRRRISRDALVEGLRAHGHRDVHALHDPDDAGADDRGNGRSRAITSSASARARSAAGPMRCRASLRRLRPKIPNARGITMFGRTGLLDAPAASARQVDGERSPGRADMVPCRRPRRGSVQARR